MNVRELYEILNGRIPTQLSCDWDNDGLMVEGDPDRNIKRALVALDATEDTVTCALEGGFDLIVTHHPLIFRPLKSITEDRAVSRCAMRCIRGGVSVMSFHTRLDAVEGGVNDALAAVIGLENISALPEIGRIGTLPTEYSVDEFVMALCRVLGCDHVNFVGENPVRRVAVVGGDGKDHYRDAVLAGADTYVTGSLSYNMMVDAAQDGLNVIEAGHFFTEQPVCTVLAKTLSELGIEAKVFYSNPVATCLADNLVE